MIGIFLLSFVFEAEIWQKQEFGTNFSANLAFPFLELLLYSNSNLYCKFSHCILDNCDTFLLYTFILEENLIKSIENIMRIIAA
jgi:hypothetical protein